MRMNCSNDPCRNNVIVYKIAVNTTENLASDLNEIPKYIEDLHHFDREECRALCNVVC
eukprot:m.73867 g.73867  ORF g.73867 m.73867 type:complete len:58 (-) comp12436_c0_seq6:1413-1586(-)